MSTTSVIAQCGNSRQSCSREGPFPRAFVPGQGLQDLPAHFVPLAYAADRTVSAVPLGGLVPPRHSAACVPDSAQVNGRGRDVSCFILLRRKLSSKRSRHEDGQRFLPASLSGPKDFPLRLMRVAFLGHAGSRKVGVTSFPPEVVTLSAPEVQTSRYIEG